MQLSFPALSSMKKSLYYAEKDAKAGCSKCQRNKIAKANTSKLNAVKAFKEYIKHLDTDTRNKLKTSMGCTDLRFTSVGSDGRVKEYRY